MTPADDVQRRQEDFNRVREQCELIAIRSPLLDHYRVLSGSSSAQTPTSAARQFRALAIREAKTNGFSGTNQQDAVDFWIDRIAENDPRSVSRRPDPIVEFVAAHLSQAYLPEKSKWREQNADRLRREYKDQSWSMYPGSPGPAMPFRIAWSPTLEDVLSPEPIQVLNAGTARDRRDLIDRATPVSCGLWAEELEEMRRIAGVLRRDLLCPRSFVVNDICSLSMDYMPASEPRSIAAELRAAGPKKLSVDSSFWHELGEQSLSAAARHHIQIGISVREEWRSWRRSDGQVNYFVEGPSDDLAKGRAIVEFESLAKKAGPALGADGEEHALDLMVSSLSQHRWRELQAGKERLLISRQDSRCVIMLRPLFEILAAYCLDREGEKPSAALNTPLGAASTASPRNGSTREPRKAKANWQTERWQIIESYLAECIRARKPEPKMVSIYKPHHRTEFYAWLRGEKKRTVEATVRNVCERDKPHLK